MREDLAQASPPGLVDAFFSLAEGAFDALLLREGLHRRVSGNASARLLLGERLGQLGPARLETLLAEFANRPVAQLLDCGETATGELVLARGAGDCVVLRYRVIHDALFDRTLVVLRDVTQVSRLEERLQVAEQTVARLRRGGHAGSFAVDLLGGEVSSSPELGEFLGRPVLGDPLEWLLSATHPEDRAFVEQVVADARAGRAGFSCEHRVVRPDGSERSLRSEASLERDPLGQARRLSGIVRDVTDQRRTAEALRSSEERFRLLAENADDVIFRYRLRPFPVCEYICPAVAKLAGYTAEQIYAAPELLFSMVHPEDLELVAGTFTANPPTGTVAVRWIRPDGTIAWTEQRLVPISDERGQMVAIQGVVRDVTERKAAERERESLLEQLTSERRWLRTLIEKCPVGVLLIELVRGREKIKGNRYAEAVFGRMLNPDGGIEQYASQVFSPAHERVPVQELPSARALRGETTQGVELLVRRLDGTEVPLLVNAGPITDEDGRVLGAVVVLDDISRMKELERLREEWNSLVAHDLRQPLNAISLHASRLAGSRSAEPSPNAAQHILSSVRQLARMVDDLMDASLLEARQLKLELRALELQPFLEGVVARAVAQTRTQTVQLLPSRTGRVLADAGRLEQVLTNLLSNAAKYGDPSEPIRIEAAQLACEVQLSVVNRGRGIPPEDLDRVFTRFHRTDSARRGPVHGHGIGLYVTQGLVEAQGGRIWVESVPGAETSFHFTLPLTS